MSARSPPCGCGDIHTSEPMYSRDFSILITFLGTVAAGPIFLPFRAVDKLFDFRDAVARISEATSDQDVAKASIFAVLGAVVFVWLGVLTGMADRFATFVLASYCIITALLWKRFPKRPDFSLLCESASGHHRRLLDSRDPVKSKFGFVIHSRTVLPQLTLRAHLAGGI
jgi:hypothetical protein